MNLENQTSEKHTAGPLKVIERKIPYETARARGHHIERSIVTEYVHPQYKAELPIVAISTGLGMKTGFGVSLVYLKEEDANLIAAAPEMLDVLEDIMNSLGTSDLENVISTIPEIIAKAKGEL